MDVKSNLCYRSESGGLQLRVYTITVALYGPRYGRLPEDDSLSIGAKVALRRLPISIDIRARASPFVFSGLMILCLIHPLVPALQ